MTAARASYGTTVADHRRAAAAGVSARDRVDAALDALAASGDPAILVGAPLVELARADAARLDGIDPATLPLHGVPFVVKDNIDVAGAPTTAACPGFARVATRDATVVARLRAAGAVVVGKANLDQFATGLVGTRSPYGTPRNPYDADVVPGGSSSGSAVAVARGFVPFALGTDTAGSGRVPAAMCGIVGLKGTVGRVSSAGVVPAVRRIDCTTVFAGTVGDAALVMGLAGGYDETDPWSRRPAFGTTDVRVVGVPDHWPDGAAPDAATLRLFDAAVDRLRALGCAVAPFDLEPFLAAGALLYGGPLVAERLASVGAALAAHAADADPTVAAIIRESARWSAADAYDTEYRLAALRRDVAPVLAAVDALALPTTPGVARLAEVAADPRGANSRLGRYTTFANLLDLAAVALPMGARPDGLPAGLQLIGPAWSDDALVALAARLSGEPVPPRTLPTRDEVPLVVVGAHLRGQPLNGQLTERGARFLASTTTAGCYRLFAMADAVPPKPALVRAATGGRPIAVEVWSLPSDQVGGFLTLVPPPLALGTVELADGTWQKGFVCEPRALDGATDITGHGGWLAYRASLDAAG
jgi:allophanate hydrolase